ncbi:MAG: tyrosinase family protein [Chloroflexota bacterium]
MPKTLSRRSFLQVVGGGASAVALASCVLPMPAGRQPASEIESEVQAISARQGEVHVRRSLASPNNDLETYREAVKRMKSLPSRDRRNWLNQANIHKDYCPHGNWYFLPWHSAYVYFLEDICRELTGNESFALPYWNWTLRPKFPEPFLHGTLNDDTRFRTNNIPKRITGPDVVYPILTSPRFTTFSNRLESGPHNGVHSYIGGHMGRIPLAAQDPIFWMHHNMVENCWSDWLSRGHTNTSDPRWLNHHFDNQFVDRYGNLIPRLTVGDILNNIRPQYRYDAKVNGQPYTSSDLEIQPVEIVYNTYKQVESIEPVELAVNQPVIKRIELDTNELKSVLTDIENQNHLVELTLVGVNNPIGNNVYIEVALNHENEIREIALDEPHFVGTLSFFMDPNHMEHAGDYVFDITDEIRELYAQNPPLDLVDIDIQFTARLHHEDENAQNQTVTINSLKVEFHEPT